jgi:hypothetical protein
MAAVLACGPGAVLSHLSAAQLWGIAPRFPAQPEVTRPRKFRAQSGILGHDAILPADETGVISGIPITSMPRTLFDLAAGSSRRRVERALNEVEVKGLTDRLSVPHLLDRYPGHRGTKVLRELLAAKTPGGITRNDFEERFVAFLDASGLPRPRLNATLALRGRFFEVDCLWQERRLIVELDGGAVRRTDQAFESDRQRDRILLAEGWRGTRVTWRQLRDEPAAIAADLRQMLRGVERAPTL